MHRTVTARLRMKRATVQICGCTCTTPAYGGVLRPTGDNFELTLQVSTFSLKLRGANGLGLHFFMCSGHM